MKRPPGRPVPDYVRAVWEWFRECGYLRRPDRPAVGDPSDDGWEVRFVLGGRSESELVRLLAAVGATGVRAFTSGGRRQVSIPGRKAVAVFRRLWSAHRPPRRRV